MARTVYIALSETASRVPNQFWERLRNMCGAKSKRKPDLVHDVMRSSTSNSRLRRPMLVTELVLVIALVFSAAYAEDRTLAPTPPMGWNSWNKFGCDVSEELIRQT